MGWVWRTLFIFCFIRVVSVEAKETKGLFSSGRRPFVEKKDWAVSILFSGFSDKKTDVDLIFATAEFLERKAYALRGSAEYFIKKNLSMGFAYEYGQNNFSLIFNVFNGFLTRYVEYGSMNVGISPYVKNYIPLTRKKWVYFTNQTSLSYNNLSSIRKAAISQDGQIALPVPGATPPVLVQERKISVINSIGIDFQPGALLFFTRNFALATQITIGSISYARERIFYDYDPLKLPKQIKQDRTHQEFNIDFNPDILRFVIGFAYYF